MLENSVFVDVDEAFNNCGTKLESAHKNGQRPEFHNMLKFFGRLKLDSCSVCSCSVLEQLWLVKS